MANPICPLCKRELSAGTLDTRLCEQCQSLIQTASRPADSRVVSSSAAGIQHRVVGHAQHDALPENLPLELHELFDNSSVASDTFEPDPLYAELFDSEDLFSGTPARDEQANPSVDTPEANLPDGNVAGSTLRSNEPAREEAQFDCADTEPSNTDRVVRSDHDEQIVPAIEASANSTTPEVSVESKVDDLQAIRDEVSADPWENPLPASEYSRNEWPVLVGPARGGLLTRFKGPIVVLVILAFAAGSYYLIYRQTSQGLVTDSPAPLRASKVAEPRASALPTSDSTAQGKAQLPAADAAVKAEPKVTQQPVVNDAATATKEESGAQGQFALQAASFPNRAGADEFAEKLKAAGVPSYVVSVELPHRGTWFRVRVGRFNTAEDAQKFAAQAQLRARATGMSLELIVSRYDQPQ